jgi:hypothetical protein
MSIVITKRGRNLNMDELIRQNEHIPAVGNTNLNARGDRLGPGGKIIKTKEEIDKEYKAMVAYNTSSTTVKAPSGSITPDNLSGVSVLTPQQAFQRQRDAEAARQRAAQAAQEAANGDVGIIVDNTASIDAIDTTEAPKRKITNKG